MKKKAIVLFVFLCCGVFLFMPPWAFAPTWAESTEDILERSAKKHQDTMIRLGLADGPRKVPGSQYNYSPVGRFQCIAVGPDRCRLAIFDTQTKAIEYVDVEGCETYLR